MKNSKMFIQLNPEEKQLYLKSLYINPNWLKEIKYQDDADEKGENLDSLYNEIRINKNVIN